MAAENAAGKDISDYSDFYVFFMPIFLGMVVEVKKLGRTPHAKMLIFQVDEAVFALIGLYSGRRNHELRPATR